MKERKVTSIDVVPIPVKKLNPKEILGYDILPNPHCNVFLCAKKHSGKTNVIFTILLNCVGKDTVIELFASTANKDNNWLFIREWCKKNGIVYMYIWIWRRFQKLLVS